MEGNGSVYQGNPVSRKTGEEGAEFLRTWGPYNVSFVSVEIRARNKEKHFRIENIVFSVIELNWIAFGGDIRICFLPEFTRCILPMFLFPVGKMQSSLSSMS